MSRYYIGIDLGGTGIKGAVVDEGGIIHTRYQTPTPVAEGATGILRALKDVITRLVSTGNSISGIGIGTAGQVNPAEGIVRYATDNLPGWTGMRLAEEVAASFALPVAIENDANAAAFGEGWLGAAVFLNHYAMLTLGTGVGGAIVHGGELISGRQGAAGEFGHMVLHPGGFPCSCGQRGCMEHSLSGTALNRLAADAYPGWDGRQLIAAFAAGNERAAVAMEVFMNDLSLAVHNIQSLFDPEVIVLGGGVAESYSLWWETWMNKLTAASALAITVVPAKLGNEAGIIGAARMIMVKEGK